jgi:hypothetical protein
MIQPSSRCLNRYALRAQVLQKLQAKRDAAATKIEAFMSEWEELEQLLSE